MLVCACRDPWLPFHAVVEPRACACLSFNEASCSWWSPILQRRALAVRRDVLFGFLALEDGT